MTRKLTLIVVLSLLAPSVVAFGAGPSKHHAKRVARPGYIPNYSIGNGWYPHDTNKLPIGTRKWFDQMLRENRSNPG